MFWIYVESYQGQPVLTKGGNSFNEAQQKAFQDLDCDFEIVDLPTTDINAASRMIKGRKLGETHNLGSALERLRHKL